MRFIHTADVHLGAVPEGSPERAAELWHTFEALIEYCNREKIELLLIAGDLFHRQPLKRELREAAELFMRLETTQVVLAAGNHDYMSGDSAYIDFVWPERVHILAPGRLDRVYLETLNTEVYGFSYPSRSVTEAVYDRCRPYVPEHRNILLAHGNVYAREDRNIPIDKRQLEQAGFDYVALGHIHKAEQFSNRMAYCGSLEPLDRTETGAHGCILGEMTGKEKGRAGETAVKLTFLQCACREYKEISCPVGEDTSVSALRHKVKEEIAAHGEQHFYTLTLTGRRGRDWFVPEESFSDIRQLIRIEDLTEAAYCKEELLMQYEGTLVAEFIRSMEREALPEEEKKKALAYGLQALLPQ